MNLCRLSLPRKVKTMTRKFSMSLLIMMLVAFMAILGGSVLAQDEDIVTMHSTDLLANEELAVPMGEEVDTSQWAKEGPYTIGFINWSTANSWTVQVDAEVAHEA